MELHERAKQARLDAGISINSLAELMGVDRGIIQRMEWRPATTLQQLETQKKVVTLGPDGLMRAMVTAKSMKAKAKDAQAVKVDSKAEPKAAPKKNPRFARPHAGRTCPVCGTVTNAPRFRFLCREHRTDENLKKFTRREVKAGTVEAAVEAEAKVALTPRTVVSIGATPEVQGTLDGAVLEQVVTATTAALMKDPEKGTALAKSVVTLALTTLKNETQFSALAELALKALDEI